jgi:hypothetical protein
MHSKYPLDEIHSVVKEAYPSSITLSDSPLRALQLSPACFLNDQAIHMKVWNKVNGNFFRLLSQQWNLNWYISCLILPKPL